MGSVHIITGQELAHVEGLSSENCFHVSCCWHLGDLQFSAAIQTLWLCAFPRRGRNTHHMFNSGCVATRVSWALLERRLEVLITWEHRWKTHKRIPKNHSRRHCPYSFFGRLAAWLNFLAKTTLSSASETGLMNLGVSSHPNKPTTRLSFMEQLLTKAIDSRPKSPKIQPKARVSTSEVQCPPPLAGQLIFQ